MALPEFIDIFQRSSNVSVHNGRSHFLIKKQGMRKWGGAAKSSSDLIMEANKQVKQMNEKIKHLEQKIDWFQSQEDEHFRNKEALARLYDQKIIDENLELME
eukprot:CAMPEP_0168334754 /NCGR_PEP_ID=MMETSP0213-20121227/10480_1 /TAXON_ID=151035 /ORGANISM="Euplotes harpa, Strain FSP1.4" /LENGTH=101 /DNA_ID=CAMNT_0008339507 /DNA_START=434 /DNA_END=739 /DNA_ORIENTATION=-